MYSFSSLEPVYCSMSGSNCCFLTCIQVSQEAGKVVWYFHLLNNFPQFVVIHTAKGFSVVDETEVDVFSGTPLLSLCSGSVGDLFFGSSVFSKPSLDFWNFLDHVMLKPNIQYFKHDLTSMGEECNCPVV